MNFLFTANIEDRENKELAKCVTIIRALGVEGVKKNELKPLQVAERFRGKPRQSPVLAALDQCLGK